MAIGGIRYLHEQGTPAPQSLSIVGYDDIELSSLMQPSLTTVRQHRYEMGRAAVETLVRMLEDLEKGRGIVMSPELVVRETTAQREMR